MKLRKIKYKNNRYVVTPLIPYDFLSSFYWPFSYYVLDEKGSDKQHQEVVRDWKLKPKETLSTHFKIENSLKFAVKESLSVDDEFYNQLKKEELSYNIILNEIYAETYKLTFQEKFFTPQKVINKDFAEGIAIKSKAMQQEPYSFLKDTSQEKPELFNPKRYDFNYFILGVGWEMDRRMQEKAMKELKKQQSKMKSRR